MYAQIPSPVYPPCVSPCEQSSGSATGAASDASKSGATGWVLTNQKFASFLHSDYCVIRNRRSAPRQDLRVCLWCVTHLQGMVSTSSALELSDEMCPHVSRVLALPLEQHLMQVNLEQLDGSLPIRNLHPSCILITVLFVTGAVRQGRTLGCAYDVLRTCKGWCRRPVHLNWVMKCRQWLTDSNQLISTSIHINMDRNSYSVSFKLKVVKQVIENCKETGRV